MSQVTVQWTRTDLLTDHQLQYANGDPMGKQIAVIPLASLAEVVEGLVPELGNTPEYILGYADALRDLKRLLAMLEVKDK